MKSSRSLLARTLATLLAAGVAVVANPAQAAPDDFTDLSLEELMSEPITSVSKRPTRLGDAAAAVTVITPEDIRAAGITSLVDALRLAPGLHVSRINSHAWAVSARGFHGVFADKLLVMIDGRTVYEPTFAGVHWSIQDVVLEDLERIEVIRGPGATLWGANAVNGVINIITKNAADTHGVLVSSAVGSEDGPSFSTRYGGQTDSDVDYRVYMKYFDRAGLVTASGTSANDDWHAVRTGFRLDWTSSAGDTYLLEGDLVDDEVRENLSEPLLAPPFSQTFLTSGGESAGNVLGRWTHALSETSEVTLQSFYSRSEIRIGGAGGRADIFDLELQHQFAPTPRQTIVWGTGYRVIDDAREPTSQSWLADEHRTASLYTAFVQDEISVAKSVQLALGFKLEHNYQTGFEMQPGARLAWKPSSEQTLWTSVSRAVRTPDRFESGGTARVAAFPTGPQGPLAEVSLVGNPDLEAEVLWAYELGYRFEPTARFALDLATFYNEYDRMIDFVVPSTRFNPAAQPPHLEIHEHAGNALAGASYGAELSLSWNAAERLNLSADYSWLKIPFLDGSREFSSAENLAHLRAHLLLPRQIELTGALGYTDRLSNNDIDAYLQLDVGVIWRASQSIEVGLWGQNLLDKQHAEFTDLHTSVVAQVPRSALLRFTSRF